MRLLLRAGREIFLTLIWIIGASHFSSWPLLLKLKLEVAASLYGLHVGRRIVRSSHLL